jgi:hypothetical protein
MLAQQIPNPTEVPPRKPAAPLQPNRIKPELCNFALTLNVYVRRLIVITRIKEKAVWANLQYCRHSSHHSLSAKQKEVRENCRELVVSIQVRAGAGPASNAAVEERPASV